MNTAENWKTMARLNKQNSDFVCVYMYYNRFDFSSESLITKTQNQNVHTQNNETGNVGSSTKQNEQQKWIMKTLTILLLTQSRGFSKLKYV